MTYGRMRVRSASSSTDIASHSRASWILIPMASLGGASNAGAPDPAGTSVRSRPARSWLASGRCRTLRMACALRSVVASMISSTFAVRSVRSGSASSSDCSSSSGARLRSSASSGSGSVSSSSRLDSASAPTFTGSRRIGTVASPSRPACERSADTTDASRRGPGLVGGVAAGGLEAGSSRSGTSSTPGSSRRSVPATATSTVGSGSVAWSATATTGTLPSASRTSEPSTSSPDDLVVSPYGTTSAASYSHLLSRTATRAREPRSARTRSSSRARTITLPSPSRPRGETSTVSTSDQGTPVQRPPSRTRRPVRSAISSGERDSRHATACSTAIMSRAQPSRNGTSPWSSRNNQR